MLKSTRGRKGGIFPALISQIEKNVVNYVKNISTGIGQFSATSDNLILIGNFNVEPEEENILDFLNAYSLKNLVKQKTCCKNSDNPTCNHLVLRNCHRSFKNTNVFETGLSDFHKMTDLF